MSRKILLLLFLTVLIISSKTVHAEILPISYYSNINSNNHAYRSDLYVIVNDNYCADDQSVWSINTTAELEATCYLTKNGVSLWRVQLFYNPPVPKTVNSLQLSYNHGSVSDSLTFNPFQFIVYDKIKQVNLNDGKSVFIMEPSFIRSIVIPENGTYYQSIMMQETNFNTSKTYYLKLLDPNTNKVLNTYKSTFYNFYNSRIILFISKNSTKSGVYNLQIYDQSNNLIGEFISYMGSYYMNSNYAGGVYIFKNLIIIDNNVYLKIRNNDKASIAVTRVSLTVLNNELQTVFSVNNSNSFTLNSNEDKLVYLGQITDNQFNQLKSGVNIMTATVFYKKGTEYSYKKITRQLTIKDISYSTTTAGYVSLGQINLIYPRPLFTVENDYFQNSKVNLSNIPIIFLFVEHDPQSGYDVTVDSISLTLHPIHGGNATVTGIYRVDQLYTSNGYPVGVYKAYVDYSNISPGVIPVVGRIVINAHYTYYIYIPFIGWVPVTVPVTFTGHVEFMINTENIEKAQEYVDGLSTPIYSKLDSLKDKFRTYDYFWIAYAKDTDAGVSGHFFDYYNTAGNTFPVTDLAQNPKILTSIGQNTLQIIFDRNLKPFFNYNDMEAVVMNNNGILREDVSYTMTDIVIGDSNATEVTLNLYTGMRVLNPDNYFKDAYQTNGYILLKHQIYDTIIPFTMIKPFSVYYDDGSLTILNKAQSSITYYPDVSDTNTYYTINSNSYMTNLPLGNQPAIYYNNNYYYINPSFKFTPRLLSSGIYPTLKAVINTDFLENTLITSVNMKTLYDYALLQLFPKDYKQLLLKPGQFYTYSFTNTTIKYLKFNDKTVNPQVTEQYKFISYTITKYSMDESLYSDSISLTAENITTYTTEIAFSNNTIIKTHLLLPDILRMNFLKSLLFSPTMYSTNSVTVITIYDPVLAPSRHDYRFMLNNIQINPLLVIRSPTHISLYYNGIINNNMFITIDGYPLILIAPYNNQ